MEIDPDLVIPDKTKSLAEGAIEPFNNSSPDGYYFQMLQALVEHYGYSIETPPLKDMTEKK